MRRLLLLPALTLALLACGDDTGTGGTGNSGATGQGGEPTGGNGGSGGTPSTGGNGGSGGTPSTGGNGGEGGTPSTGGNGGNGGTPSTGGNGGQGGTPQGGNGGQGGSMGSAENCSDGADNDGDLDVDCADTDCASAAVCGKLVINEIDYDQFNTDAAEFVEVFNAGTSTVDLSTVQLVLVNGAGANPGEYRTVSLTGTLAPGGYLVVADTGTTGIDPGAQVINFTGATDQIQNGPTDAVALYDVDANALLDTVSYEGTVPTGIMLNSTPFDFFEMAGTDLADTNANEARSLVRFPNGHDTGNNAADFVLSSVPSPGAANSATEVCDNGTDDDGDLAVDCADTDCTASPLCVEVCDDTIDNNGNGQTDCQEASCNGQVCDAFGRECASLVCTCPGGATETNCNDNLDGDCDGDIDCGDSDCASAANCLTLSVSGVDYPVIAQGGRLVINGAGFTGATNVTIGGVAQTGFTVNSDTQITIPGVLDTTPIGASQPLVVSVGAASSLPFNVAPIRLQISESDADTPGADTAEFIELSTGVPGVNLAGYSVVLFNGGAPNGAGSYLAIELAATTDANGRLLVGNSAVVPAPALTFANNTLQNGADGIGLYQSLPAAWPANTLASTTGLIDSLVYDTADADADVMLDILYGPVGSPGRVQVDEGTGGAGGPAEMNSVRRCADGRRDGSKFGVGTPTPGAANNCP